MKKPFPEIIYFEWLDAVSDHGWKKVRDNEEADECYCCGFIISETKKSITVAVAYSDGQANGQITVPKAWIKRRTRLALPRRKK